MDLMSYARALDTGSSERPLDIDGPRKVTFDFDDDGDVARYMAITGEHADAYNVNKLAYDDDTDTLTAVVAPTWDEPSAGDALGSGYGVLHDLNRGRLPAEVIGEKAYKQRYGGSSGRSAQARDGDSDSTAKDVFEHMVGEGLYERVKQAAS